MLIISEKICTTSASVTIVYTKETAFRPSSFNESHRPHYVEDDADTVFIVGMNQGLVGSSSISAHLAALLKRALGRLVLRDVHSRGGRLR